MFFEKNKLYNDYFPSYEYDTLQAYSYGYNRFISKGCLVWWGTNTIYVGKMHNILI